MRISDWSSDVCSSDRIMVFGSFDPIVEVEDDGPGGHVEGELTITAFIILPATVLAFEEVVTHRLDRFRERDRYMPDLLVVKFTAGDLDRCIGQVGAAFTGTRVNLFDLTAVATAIEPHGDKGDASSCQYRQDSSLIDGKNLARSFIEFCLAGEERSEEHTYELQSLMRL